MEKFTNCIQYFEFNYGDTNLEPELITGVTYTDGTILIAVATHKLDHERMDWNARNTGIILDKTAYGGFVFYYDDLGFSANSGAFTGTYTDGQIEEIKKFIELTLGRSNNQYKITVSIIQ